MAMDYHERKFASRNRPRRSSIWGYVAGVTGVLLVVFAAGAATGWFACRYRTKPVPAAQPAAGQSGQQAAASQPAPTDKPAPGKTPLTFYETLPQGSKSVIGSGINTKLPTQQAAEPLRPTPVPSPQPQSAAPPASVPVKAAPAQVKPPAVAPVAPASAKPATSASTAEKPVEPAAKDGARCFTVQVASVKEKAEAETLRSRLAAKGLNPMVVAVNVPGKGLVYRVRAGRHLLQSEAQEIAGKLGSGAIVVPE